MYGQKPAVKIGGRAAKFSEDVVPVADKVNPGKVIKHVAESRVRRC
jgi:hypothetical protein